MPTPGSVWPICSTQGRRPWRRTGSLLTEDDVLTAVLEDGAEDVATFGDTSSKGICEPNRSGSRCRTACRDAGIDTSRAEASSHRRDGAGRLTSDRKVLK